MRTCFDSGDRRLQSGPGQGRNSRQSSSILLVPHNGSANERANANWDENPEQPEKKGLPGLGTPMNATGLDNRQIRRAGVEAASVLPLVQIQNIAPLGSIDVAIGATGRVAFAIGNNPSFVR
jgi:hypothetical protein